MKKSFGNTVKILAVVAAMTASAAVSAQSAGSWAVKLGVNRLAPKVDSGSMTAPALPGSKTTVSADTALIFSASYMFTDHISVEGFGGLPYKYEWIGDGSVAGAGKIGTSEVLPPTIFAQYRFMDAKSKFRPYIGLGLSYAYFQKETGSGQLTALLNTGSSVPATFKIDNKFGFTPQIGATYAVNDQWFADFAITKTYMKTTAHYSTGQTQNVRLDPVGVSFAVGYRF